MHSQRMAQDGYYRELVARLSTTLTMAEATYTGRLAGGATSTMQQKAGSVAATVAGGEGVS